MKMTNQVPTVTSNDPFFVFSNQIKPT